MIDDDYVPGEGDVMPALWWRLPHDVGLAKRWRSSEVPGHPLIAFADEFTSTLRTAGPLYIDLHGYTAWDTTSSTDSVERQFFEALTGAFPGMFSVVVDAGSPTVWLALRLTRLTNPIATAIIDHHDRYLAYRRTSA
ncbi:hypothetical protein [Micromonospora haikouensis]|uniref:hypothetical protein n=1 Tax=Micromonospora haikouensis TaxID=686309 RepID=UPI003D73C738